MSARDPVARGLAAAALSVARIALVVAALSYRQGQTFLDDVRTLGRALDARGAGTGGRPPPRLDVD